MDGHAVQVGGVIVDSGKFDWTGGKFPCMTEPDESYHGTIYTEKYSFAPYIVKARMQLMRDFGCYPAANSSFLLNLGLETLPVRMKQYCENALTVAKFLESNDKVESVAYPGLESDKYHKLAEKYLPLGTAGVISFVIKGGRDTAAKFMDSLKLASNEVHVADIRTCILHPASATHRQLSDEQLVAAGINGGMIRNGCVKFCRRSFRRIHCHSARADCAEAADQHQSGKKQGKKLFTFLQNCFLLHIEANLGVPLHTQDRFIIDLFIGIIYRKKRRKRVRNYRYNRQITTQCCFSSLYCFIYLYI